MPTVNLDEELDQSIMSQSNTRSKTSRKPSKSRAKGSNKVDTVDVDSELDMLTTDPKPEPKKKRATRGKKRPSDGMDKDEVDGVHSEDPGQMEPPKKKKASTSRSSVAQQHTVKPSDDDLAETDVLNESAPEEKPKKNRRTTKKNLSAKSRKTSESSVSHMTASEPDMPIDSELDKALEIDLDRGVPIDEEQAEQAAQKPKMTKSKSNKKSKTVAEKSTLAPSDAAEEEKSAKGDHDEAEVMEPEETDVVPKKTKSTKGNSKRKTAKNPKEQTSSDKEEPEKRASSAPDADNEGADPGNRESFVSVEVISRDPFSEPAAEPTRTINAGQTRKKGTMEGKREQSKSMIRESDAAHKPAVRDITGDPESRGYPKNRVSAEVNDGADEFDNVGEPVEEQDLTKQHARRQSSKVPPKSAERYSDLPQEKHFADSIARSHISPDGNGKIGDTGIFADGASTVSPLPPSSASTSQSPQSSDAENRPPSAVPAPSRVSASRTPILSSPEQRKMRVPLAANTPSPLKRNANIGRLQTSRPWTPVDIDGILFAGSSDKENDHIDGVLSGAKEDLSSPEKRMTVEEWILSNAKNGEERLKRECERLIGHFEKEGGRALQVLEGIECID